MELKQRNLTPKQMLQERGITQVKVAFDLDVDRSVLNLVVNGWQPPTPELREKLSVYLNVEPEELGWAE